jgi:hypothetical protein
MKLQQANDKGDRLKAMQYDWQGDPVTPFIAIQSDIAGFAATLTAQDGARFTTGRFYPTKREAIAAIKEYYFGVGLWSNVPW